MATIWKLSAPSTGTLTDVGTLDVENLNLAQLNQAKDVLTFDDPSTEFDAALRWPIDTAIVLARNAGAGDVTWFSGTVRDTERIGTGDDLRIRYTVHGPWQWLERTPYIQQFKVPSDPSNTASSLVNAARGRVVLGQKGDGTKLYLGPALNEILDVAIAAGAPIAYNALTLSQYVPWEEATDLSCAEALMRVLRWRPDLVCGWDYSVNPPKLTFTPQASLSTISLAVQPAGTTDAGGYAPFESIRLRTRPDLVIASAALCYLATNRDNEASWETVTTDIYPATGHVVGESDQLLRTVQLAGSVATSSVLQQKVNVDPIPSQLTLAGPLTSGSDFTALKSWWQNHAQQLRQSNVTIKQLWSGIREAEDGSAVNAALTNELVKGAVTDWMESNQSIVTERQRVSVMCLYDITDPVTSKVETQVSLLATTITATNAATKTYAFTASASYTPAETVPTGLAQSLYTAFSAVQHEGTVSLVESDCSYAVGVGRALLLTGSLTAWSTMQAVIQRADYDLDRGRTTFTVGPPKQLGIADLVDVFRNNRTRPPTTSHLTRTTGKSGTADSKQGLALHHPSPRTAGDQHQGPRIYTSALSVAGVVPTSAEIATALAAAYTGTDVPRRNDTILLTLSSVLKFRFTVTKFSVSSTIFGVGFTVGSASYYAVGTQTGIY